jgi:hypothetical protein
MAEADTITLVISRLRDKDDDVRIAAFDRIAQLPFDYLTEK